MIVAERPAIRDGKRLKRYGYRVELVTLPAGLLKDFKEALLDMADAHSRRRRANAIPKPQETLECFPCA